MKVQSGIIHKSQKTWKQPNEWTNKTYTLKLEYCLAIKRYEIPTHVATCMKFKNIILSEKTNHKDHILYDSAYIKHIKKGEISGDRT